MIERQSTSRTINDARLMAAIIYAAGIDQHRFMALQTVMMRNNSALQMQEPEVDLSTAATTSACSASNRTNAMN